MTKFVICALALLFTCSFGLNLGDEQKSRTKIIREGFSRANSLAANVSQTWLEETKKAQATKRNTTEQVALAEANIIQQLKDLANFVKTASIDAHEKQISISNCIAVEEQQLKNVTSNSSISSCTKILSLDYVQAKVTVLSLSEIKIVGIVPLCITTNPINKDSLELCISKRLTAATAEADDLKYQIDEEIADIAKQVTQCVEYNYNNLEGGIKEITYNFNECVTEKL